MFIKRLIFILLASIWAMPATVGTHSESQLSEPNMSQTCHRPQWEDVGLHDVLAVSAQSTIVPPTVVRLVHYESTTGIAQSGTQSRISRHWDSTLCTRAMNHDSVRGYLCLLCSLRL